MGFPDDEPGWDTPSAETGSFRADTFERLQLTKEERKVELAKVKKFEAMKGCLELRKERAAFEAEMALQNRFQAEAERDRLRELRLLRRERRKLESEKRKVEEAKRQGALEARKLATELRIAQDEAINEHEKRIWLEFGERLDPETAEFLACPKCGVRTIIPEDGGGRVCPECCHRKEA